MNRYQACCNSGLYSVEEEHPYFSWEGCEVNYPESHCRGLGNTVEDATGYPDLTEAQDARSCPEKFRICQACLCLAANIEEGEL